MTDDYQPTDRLTRHQAAAVLGLKVGMIDHLRRKGVLAAEKNDLTGAVRFVYADILALKLRREAIGRVITGPQNRPLPANLKRHVEAAHARSFR